MPAGRPSKYDEVDLMKVEKLAGFGLVNDELADMLSINSDTFYEWKKTHTEFSEAIKRGKLKADLRVTQSLYKRANGFFYDEKTKEKGVETKIVTKMVVPDTTAAIFWLKNRQPEKWRDKQEVDHTVSLKQIFKIGDQEIEL